MVLDEASFCKRVERAYSLGNEVAIHIIGDAALDIVLDLVERIQDPARNTQFELIHCAVTRPDQLERMKKASCYYQQAAHLYPSSHHTKWRNKTRQSESLLSWNQILL